MSAAAQIGLGERIDQSQELYSVLAAIGRMVREVNGKQLLLIADEAAKLEAVSDGDATEAHWMSVNRLIFDDNNDNFGFIYTLSGKSRNSIPSVLSDPQVENRIGKENYIQLLPLPPSDVSSFLARLTQEFINLNCVNALLDGGEIQRTGFVQQAYPFTQDALREFVDFFARSQENSKPRDITGRTP